MQSGRLQGQSDAEALARLKQIQQSTEA
jgi:hypothetical protein